MYFLLLVAYFAIPVVLLVVVVAGMLTGSRRERELEELLENGRTIGGMNKLQSCKGRTYIRKDSVS